MAASCSFGKASRESTGIYSLKSLKSVITTSEGGSLFSKREGRKNISAYGAGALNLININTGKVQWLSFEDGLPSNTIKRIRADNDGNLWIITLNGLCKYNPNPIRFTRSNHQEIPA